MKQMNFVKKLNMNSGSVLVLAVMATNICNFGFSAVLGRQLSFTDFAVFTVINSLYYLVNIVLLALANTTNHWVVFLSTSQNKMQSSTFFWSIHKVIFLLSIIGGIIWLFTSPLLQQFFHFRTILPIILFSVIVFIGPSLALAKGYLQGSFLFISTAIVLLSEVLAKILFAGFFLSFHGNGNIFIIIPLSVLVSWLVSIWYVYAIRKQPKETSRIDFPMRFFLAALLTTAGSSAFLSLDVVLVKHFVTVTTAGEYSLLSLVGKMIYFFGSIGNVLLITYISRFETHSKQVTQLFRFFVILTCMLSAAMFLALGVLGNFFVPLFFGSKAASLTPFLLPYTLSITLYTISSTIITYHVTLHHYVFSGIALLATFLMVLGITLFHNGILTITHVTLSVNIITLFLVSILHFFKRSEHISAAKIAATK